jgi:hypothetical protein
LTQLPFHSESKEKSQKFGNFMGKLLLKSGAKNNKQYKKAGSKDENLKQRILTEEPYAGLFRIRKTRSDQLATGSATTSCNKINSA